MTTDEFMNAVTRVDRNLGPRMLFEAYIDKLIDGETLSEVLIHIWTMAEFPGRALPRWLWVEWFRQASFATPAGPLNLYRGAIPRHARGMSWTTDRAKAEFFAHRFDGAVMHGNLHGYVYAATIPPEGVLADIDALYPGGRHEYEIVIDPDFLPRRIKRAPPVLP